MSSTDVTIRIANQIASDLGRFSSKLDTFTRGGSSSGGSMGGNDFWKEMRDAFAEMRKEMQENIKLIKEHSKATKDSTTAMSGFRSFFSTGVGMAQTLNAGARGDILGAVSGVMNIGGGVADAFSKFSGASRAIPIAGAFLGAAAGFGAMGINNIQQNWESGYQQNRAIGQLANLTGVGVGGLGNKGFTNLAASVMMQPGEFAGIGRSFAMAGGGGGGVQEMMRLSAMAQKNFGASADGLARAVGDFTSWAQPQNVADTFTKGFEAASRAGVGSQFLTGQWTGAQSGMMRALTLGGGQARRGSIGGVAAEDVFNDILAKGTKFGYHAGDTAAAYANIAGALPQSFQNPAAFAFLTQRMGLTPREMMFPDSGTFANISKSVTQPGAGERLGISGPMQAKQMFMNLGWGGQAANLLAQQMFPGETGAKSEKDLSKALEAAQKGDAEKYDEIIKNTSIMATALDSGGIKMLLTSMDASLKLASMAAVKSVFGDVNSGAGVEAMGAVGMSLKQARELNPNATQERLDVGYLRSHGFQVQWDDNLKKAIRTGDTYAGQEEIINASRLATISRQQEAGTLPKDKVPKPGGKKQKSKAGPIGEESYDDSGDAQSNAIQNNPEIIIHNNISSPDGINYNTVNKQTLESYGTNKMQLQRSIIF